MTTLPNKALQDPAYNSTAWNVPLNANFNNTDAAFGGVQSFDLSSASGTVNVSGTVYVGAYPANTASYIPLIFSLTGAMTAAVNLQLPSGVGGRWLCNNATTGAFAVTISSAGGGASITVTQGNVSDFYSDGTNIVAIGTNNVPTGTLIAFAGSSAPTGYMLSYGQSISTTTYDNLFGVIGYLYGGSGGSFNVPDLRGQCVVAPDNMGGTAFGRLPGLHIGTQIGAFGGTINLTVGNLPAHSHLDLGHSHGVSDPGHSHGGVPQLGFPFGGAGNGVNDAYGNTSSSGTGITVNTSNANISFTGSNGPVSVVQTTIGINWAIKY